MRTLIPIALALTLVPTAAAHAEPGLVPLFQALEATEAPGSQRTTRILWWGDSAVVSDGYTGHLREALQKRFGDGGPGFVHVAPTFSGYLHKQVRMKLNNWERRSILLGSRKANRYGLGGVVSTSFGGASTTYTARDDRTFDVVEVLYRGWKQSGALQLYVGGAGSATEVFSTRRDEPADELWRVELDKPTTEVRVRAGGEGRVSVYGVVLERKGAGVVLDTMGIVGIRARRWFKIDADHFAGQIALRKPDLLVLNFGGNERVDPGLRVEDHAEEMTQMVKLVRAGKPNAGCLLVGPLAHGKWRQGRIVLDPALDKIYQAQRRAAAATGCAFLDTVSVMGGGDRAVSRFRDKGWIAGDLAHLNGKGHRELGRLLAAELLARYDAWKASKVVGTSSPTGGGAPSDKAPTEPSGP